MKLTENISDISTISTLVCLSVDLRVFSGDICLVVEIKPSRKKVRTLRIENINGSGGNVGISIQMQVAPEFPRDVFTLCAVTLAVM
jgi:hypothetical protein